jgi:hypothetical protein
MSYATHRAFEILDAERQDGFYESLLMAMDSLSQDQRLDFLAALGRFAPSFLYETENLDKIQERVGPLDSSCLSFAVSTFDADIRGFNLARIAENLSHSLFNQVKDPLTYWVLRELTKCEQAPDFIESRFLAPLVSVNINAFDVMKKRAYTNLLTNEAKRFAPTSDMDGERLAQKIHQQYVHLCERWDPALIALKIEDDEIELLRRMTQSYLCKAIRDYDLLAFDRTWGEGGALFFGSLVFARELEKESSRQFWNELYQWTGTELFKNLRWSPSTISKTLRDFIERKLVACHTSLSGSRQYVTTFRMHSIVANRPRSKELIAKFLVRVAKQAGICYQDEENQRLLLEESLFDDARSIERRKVTEDLSTPYLQVPIETAYAFLQNRAQVIEFLQPIYDWVESSLIEESPRNLNTIPLFLQDSILRAIEQISREDIIKLRTLAGSQTLGTVSLQYSREYAALEYVVAPFLLSDVNPFSKIIFTLIVDEKAVYTKEINHQTNGEDVITDQLVIACARIPSTVTYTFSAKTEILKEGRARFSRIFDLEGNPLTKVREESQSVYFLATPESFTADHYELEQQNILGEYSMYRAQLGIDSPILIESILYGLDERKDGVRAGIFGDEAVYSQTKIQAGSQIYTPVAFIPKFWVTGILKDQLRLIINGHDAAFRVDESTMTGQGRNFTTLHPSDGVSAVKAGPMQIRIFDLQRRRDVYRHDFFVIKALRYTFSQPLYHGPSDLHIMSLECEQKELVFRQPYEEIPPKLDRFWIADELLEKAQLLIDAPVIDVLMDGKSIFGQKLWFEEVVEKRRLEVKLPSSYTAITLKTVDAKAQIIHKLRARSLSFESSPLFFCSHIEDRFLTLVLEYADREGHLYSCKVCELYYKVSENEKSTATYFDHEGMRLKGDIGGFRISLSVIVPKNRSYTVRVYDPAGICLADTGLPSDGQYTYHQEQQPVSGLYRLEIHKESKRTFASRSGEGATLVYSTSVQSPIQEPLSFKVFACVKRTLIPNKDPVYRRELNLPNFYIEGLCAWQEGEKDTARGYFLHKRSQQKIFLENLNPMNVERKGNLDGAMLLRITDNNKRGLRVHKKNGYVNDPDVRYLSDEIECWLFLAKPIE